MEVVHTPGHTAHHLSYVVGSDDGQVMLFDPETGKMTVVLARTMWRTR